MRRDQLYDLIEAAATAIQQDTVIVIGSQAILASLPDRDLPRRAVMSPEADMIPFRDDERGTFADILDGAIGELSPFDLENHVYARTRGSLLRHVAPR